MATLPEFEARLEALKARRDSAVARASYDGRSAAYRGTAEIAMQRRDPDQMVWMLDARPA
jgi:hypothetical protein